MQLRNRNKTYDTTKIIKTYFQKKERRMENFGILKKISMNTKIQYHKNMGEFSKSMMNFVQKVKFHVLEFYRTVPTRLTKHNINIPSEKQRKDTTPIISEISRDSGNSDRVSGHIVDTKDVMDKTERKINILKEHKSQLLDDVQSNNIAGEMFVALVREVATEDEVEKVLLHIAEVGSVTHLLVLLTRRLARVEDEKEKIDSKEGKKLLCQKEEKLLEQLGEADRIRQYRYDRGKIVWQIIGKYFNEDFQFKFDYFLRTRVEQIIDLRELDDKIRLFEQTVIELATQQNLSDNNLNMNGNLLTYQSLKQFRSTVKQKANK